MNSDILIIVKMLAYNHEKYISQAIESVLMQETVYRVRLVIAEDCSSDNTREIVKEYHQKYPDKIKLILNDRNLGMKKNSANIYRYTMNADYLAVCEGDDYWTDSHKLQKQVSFLEEHPEYIGTAHNVRMVDKHGATIRKSTHTLCDRKNSCIYDLKVAERNPLFLHCNSLVYRNILKLMSARQKKMFLTCKVNGDVKLWTTLAAFGKVKVFSDYMSCYRHISDTGFSYSKRTKGKNMYLNYYNQYKILKRYMKSAYDIDYDVSAILLNFIIQAWVLLLDEPNLKNAKVFWKLLCYKDIDRRIVLCSLFGRKI